jgi:hypothetical protein
VGLAFVLMEEGAVRTICDVAMELVARAEVALCP